MTLGEGKAKVYMLLDEYSNGGVVDSDEDIDMKMTAFFDIAQKELAQIRRILKIHRVEREAGKRLYGLPKDFTAVWKIWVDGKDRTKAVEWRAGQMVIPEETEGEVELEYFAMPATIPEDAPDDYEFEIAEEAAQCMPFYVAAQQLLADIVTDSAALLNIYYRKVQLLNTAVPGVNTGRVRQSFFRGWR